MSQPKTTRVGDLYFDVYSPVTVNSTLLETPLYQQLELVYTNDNTNVIIGFNDNKQCTTVNITYDTSIGYFPNGKILCNLSGTGKRRIVFSVATYTFRFGEITGTLHVLMNKMYICNGVLYRNIVDWMFAAYKSTTVIKQYINTGLCSVFNLLSKHNLHLVHLPRHYTPDTTVAAYSGDKIIHIQTYNVILTQHEYFRTLSNNQQNSPILLSPIIRSVTAGYAFDVLSHNDWPTTIDDVVETAELLMVWCEGRPDTIRALDEVLAWFK